MQNFIEALEKCVQTENWYGALFIALTLPDICGKIEFPEFRRPGPRYEAWFDKYLSKFYCDENRLHTHSDQRIAAIQNSIPPHIGKRKRFAYMTGKDLYALRCAYLHEGSDELSGQTVEKTLQRFVFWQPPKGCVFHNNIRDDNGDMTLQIQISVFVDNVIEAIKAWINEIKDDHVKIGKVNNLATINFSSNFSL
ncbi:hypothetical protein HCY66_06050 [Acinetobacter radioresistens]|uniref:hypothetical protein n=1 Tax=Acinetobacter radioresistens TaxID=40216 RepID=UPI002005E1DA|nr:hypothetical protein [Acinetobacter radioresistens]MCK4089647.1 hypothetical protein [Acinetobacter radioresistens]